MADETKDDLVQVVLRLPRADLEAVKRDTCVEMSSTAIAAFIHKALRDRGIIEE